MLFLRLLVLHALADVRVVFLKLKLCVREFFLILPRPHNVARGRRLELDEIILRHVENYTLPF